MLMRMLWPRAITPWWVTHVGACHGPSDSHFLFTWYVAQSGLKLRWSYIEVQLLNRSQLWAQYTQPAGIKLNPWRGWMEPNQYHYDEDVQKCLISCEGFSRWSRFEMLAMKCFDILVLFLTLNCLLLSFKTRNKGCDF